MDASATLGRRLSVTGLGYVGLPVACAFAALGAPVVGYDVDAKRIDDLKRGVDRTGEVAPEALRAPGLTLTDDPEALRQADFHVVTVPTPIDAQRRPDLGPLIAASRAVGKRLKKGDVVVYESTVYPGATEEDCAPILEAESGLSFGRDFTLGYSPERINPGDKSHRFETITKVVSGSDAATLDLIAAVYGAAVTAGVHRAPSIKVAEAAKVIENTQRDLNIALMNELALIFDRLDIRTKDVLEAAATKWNFLRFTPGLVGGHCIGVDPYYLTAKAEAAGYTPQVILAGRRINDAMGAFVAQQSVKLLMRKGVSPTEARIGVFGLAFKEDVPDLRNSRTPDIVAELAGHGLTALVCDPMVDEAEALAEFGLRLAPSEAMRELDALILAAPHRALREQIQSDPLRFLRPDGVLFDVKSALDPSRLPSGLTYRDL